MDVPRKPENTKEEILKLIRSTDDRWMLEQVKRFIINIS